MPYSARIQAVVWFISCLFLLTYKEMAVGAVWSEPLSSRIPVNREKYRDFRNFSPKNSLTHPSILMDRNDLFLLFRVAAKLKQGIISGVSGN